MSQDNILKKPENLSVDNLETCYLVCIFVDIRNSTQLNKKFENQMSKIKEIYSDTLNPIYQIFSDNGFRNTQIQGDGIYSLFAFKEEQDKNNFQQIHKVINDINLLMDEVYSKYKIKLTLSASYGKEYYSAFGSTKNNKKHLAFFNNVVSYTKKLNSNSRRDESKIIIHKLHNCYGFNEDKFQQIHNLLPKQQQVKFKDVFIKGAGYIGECRIYKW